jgi:hypothetical protein
LTILIFELSNYGKADKRTTGKSENKLLTERSYNMQEKKQIIFKTPDITKMQEVVINPRTKIYIAVGADPNEARSRYQARQDAKGKVLFAPKKPALA